MLDHVNTAQMKSIYTRVFYKKLASMIATKHNILQQDPELDEM